MKTLSAVLLLLVAVVAEDYDDSSEEDYHDSIGIPLAAMLSTVPMIAGGYPVEASVKPFLVGVAVKFPGRMYSVCGASMLSNTHSVTAAHCWKTRRYQAIEFTLAFGTANVFEGGTRVTTNNVLLHPDYNYDYANNDIALITHKFVEYSDTIQPISLPDGDLLDDDFDGTWATAVGFGRTTEGNPGTRNVNKFEVSLLVISNEVCAATYDTYRITDSSLCVDTTGGFSTCPGDSGGPLSIMSNDEDVLIGITSFGSKRGCQHHKPAVFTRVTSFVSWIEENI